MKGWTSQNTSEPVETLHATSIDKTGGCSTNDVIIPHYVETLHATSLRATGRRVLCWVCINFPEWL